MDLVVLVSGRGSNLRALVHAIEDGTCRGRIVGIVCDRPNAPALEIAREHGIPTDVVPLAKGDDRDAWNAHITDVVASRRPDLVVLAGFMRVLGQGFVRRFHHRIVNVHPSLLPSFPGHDATAQAIRAGVKITGCTVHLVDEGVDSGAILAQVAVPVHEDDDDATLHARIQTMEHKIVPRVIDAIARGVITLDPPRVASPLSEAHAALVWPPLLGARP